MMNTGSNNRIFQISCTIIVVLFLALSIGSSLTHRPQIDEGMFASPALNLAEKGFLGTTVLETENSPLTRISERTYWVMPLFLINVAASFKVLGFSLFTMRLVSVFWGLILILSWYFIALKLSENRLVALLTLVFAAFNYTILDTASSGRMDMMSASLGFAAIAVYLLVRERDLTRAVLFSQILVVASGLTHPNGILAFCGVLFLTLFLDFRRLGIKQIAVGLIPYLIGGAVFGWWVWQDPPAFKNQFIDNMLMSGRMKGFSSPLSGFIREFTERYPHAHGLQATSEGHSAPVYLKSLILVGYVAGIFGVLMTKSLRTTRNYRALLIMTAIYFVMMSLIDGQKETPYLVHIVPFYCALLAIFLHSVWEKRFVPAPLPVIAAALLLMVSAGGMALRIQKNTYGNFYQPTVDFLKQNAGKDQTIMATSDFGFGLNFPKNLVDDGRFGYYTGKRPEYIVYDDSVKNSWLESKEFFPEFYEYFPRLLSEQYEVVYENDVYKVYKRR